MKVYVDVPETRRGEHGVYLCYADPATLLYVGRTQNLYTRLRTHASSSGWWPAVRQIEWITCDGPSEARLIERDHIQAFRPVGNTVDVVPLRQSRLTLPESARGDLIALYSDAIADGSHSLADERLNAYIVALRMEGWTLSSIGAPLGYTAEAIRIREARAHLVPGIPVAPPVPKKVVRSKPAKPQVPAETLADLRQLQPLARRCNGVSPVGSPERVAAERFTLILADLATQGFSAYHLAKALGITTNAVRARLARHGYMNPCPSVADQVYLGRPRFDREPKTRCKRDHDLSGENLYLVGGDPRRRVCRECDRQRGREYVARKRSAVSA